MKVYNLAQTKYWLVDDIGITEQDITGTYKKAILWRGLLDVGKYHILGEADGKKISLRLDSQKRYELTEYIKEEWKKRNVEHYNLFCERRERNLKEAIFLYIPLLLFSPFLVLLGFWLTSKAGVSFSFFDEKSIALFVRSEPVIKMLIFESIYIVGMWTCYLFFLKKTEP